MISPISILRAAVAGARSPAWCGRRIAAAQAQHAVAHPRRTPRRNSRPRVSASGSYLAARHAGTQRDAAAAAPITARRCAAIRAIPNCSNAPSSRCCRRRVDEAVRLAERVLQVDKTDRIARLVLGVRALKQKQYPAARQQLAQSVRGPITDLDRDAADRLDQCGANDGQGRGRDHRQAAGPEWYALFKDLHAGLILDLAGNRKEAGKRFERAYKLDANALRVVEAYGRWLSRNGNKDEALKVYEAFDKALPHHPLIVEAMDETQGGEKLAPLVDSRRPAPPKCCTGSAPRSAAAAARISASSISSSRSISRRTIRSR